MALIPCPECGKEISDQAPACIHCGYPLPPKGPELLPPDEPNRFSVVLTAKCNYPENRRRTIRVLIDELGISKTEAEAYMDNTELGPVLLRSGMTEESARDFAGILARAGAHVQVVDGSQPCDLAPHTGSATPRPHLWRGGLGRNPGQPVSGACRIRNFRLLIPALSRRLPLIAAAGAAAVLPAWFISAVGGPCRAVSGRRYLPPLTCPARSPPLRAGPIFE